MREILFNNKFNAFKFIFGSLLQAVFQIAYSVVVAILIGMIPGVSLGEFWKTVLILSLALLMLPILQVVSRLLRIRYTNNKHLELRKRVFSRIMDLDYKTFNEKSREEYISILTNDMLTFENVFFPTLMNIIASFGIYFFSFLILLYFDWRLALTVIFISMLLYFAMKLFEKKTIRKQNLVLRTLSDVTISTNNTLNGLELIKLNNIEDKFLDKSLKDFEKLEDKKMSLNIFNLTQKQITKFIGSLIFILIIYYSGHRLLEGRDLTKVALIVGLANNMVWPVTDIMPLFNQLNAVTNSMRRHINLKSDASFEGKKSFNFNEKIEVRGLQYKYGLREIIKNANFEIEKGKKYLIKGPSGGGKSTLLKIISKSLFNYKGEVLYDGVDLKKISDVSFSENVAFIFQDVFLLEDSLRNNITLYRDIEDDKVLEVIKKAGLTDFLESHGEGLDTKIEENGKNLSGGQRQRISIARALIRDAKILFVDEATAALDEEKAKIVETSLLESDSTVIAITHKFIDGVTKKYDYVLEINDGMVNKIPSSVYFREEII